MADATAAFFGELGGRGHEPLLKKASGTLRFDLRDGRRVDRWLVAVTKGDVTVSHRNVAADCIVSSDKALFENVASGKTNAMAALLRGAIGVEGDVQLLVLFQRLFPGPPRTRKRRRTSAAARRSS
jgi:putative sterol carrier protein